MDEFLVDQGHGFKIGDVAFLKALNSFAIIQNENNLKYANATPSKGIRKATKGEARKFRKEYNNLKKGRK